MTGSNHTKRDDELNNEQLYDVDDTKRHKNSDSPEPPPNYSGNSQLPINFNQDARNPSDSAAFFEFQSTRRMISAAQIMSLVSLVIGGVLLSSAALVVAIIAYRKVSNRVRSTKPETNTPWVLLKKTCIVAIAMSCIALAANTASMVLFYPTFIQALQTGDFSSYLGMNGLSNPGTSSSGSFWG